MLSALPKPGSIPGVKGYAPSGRPHVEKVAGTPGGKVDKKTRKNCAVELAAYRKIGRPERGASASYLGPTFPLLAVAVVGWPNTTTAKAAAVAGRELEICQDGNLTVDADTQGRVEIERYSEGSDGGWTIARFYVGSAEGSAVCLAFDAADHKTCERGLRSPRGSWPPRTPTEHLSAVHGQGDPQAALSVSPIYSVTVIQRPDTRRALLDAATAVVAEHGVEGTSLRTVCDRVGVRLPTLYHHFGDKQGLLDAVLDAAMTTYLARKDAVPVTGDAATDLRAGWDNHVGFARTHPAVYPLMFPAGAAAEPAVARASRARLRAGFDGLAADGALRPGVTAADATRALSAALRGVALTVCREPGDPGNERLSATVRDAVVGALVREETP